MKKENQNLKGVVEDMNTKDINNEEVLIRFKFKAAENTKEKNLEQRNYDSENKSAAEEQSTANQGNRIVIKKMEKNKKLKRGTHYLGKPLLQRIERTAKQLNMGKSALVRFLLKEGLDMIEIEE